MFGTALGVLRLDLPHFQRRSHIHHFVLVAIDQAAFVIDLLNGLWRVADYLLVLLLFPADAIVEVHRYATAVVGAHFFLEHVAFGLVGGLRLQDPVRLRGLVVEVQENLTLERLLSSFRGYLT